MQRLFIPLITGSTFQAMLVIFTIHTCSYIQENFHHAPYHTCQGNIDGKVESQADGVNAQFMAANQQTENNPLIK